MVTPSAGAVVMILFPFSDLSNAKLRPAVVLADAKRGDWILCQITSKPYADVNAVRLQDEDFSTGSLHRLSFARPGKVFTAHESLFISQAGTLEDASFRNVANAVIGLLRSHLPD